MDEQPWSSVGSSTLRLCFLGKPLTLCVLHLLSCSEGGPELTPVEGLVHWQPQKEGR